MKAQPGKQVSEHQSSYSMLVVGPVRPVSRPAGILLGIAFLSWYVMDSMSFNPSVGLVFSFFVASLFFAYRASLGILPSMRLLLLAGPGIAACFVYWLTDGTMFVTYYAGEWLTPIFVREFAMASAVAGLASVVGHMAGARSMPAPFNLRLYTTGRSEVKAVSWMGLAVAVLMLLDQAYRVGDYLHHTGSYGKTVQIAPPPPLLGIWNSVGMYLILVSFLGLHYRDGRMRRPRVIWVVLVLSVIMNMMLRGLRQDTFPVLGIIIFFSWLLIRPQPPARPVLYAILIVSAGYVVGVFTGRLRTTFSWAGFQNLLDSPLAMFFFKNYTGGTSFLLETASSVAGTFLVVFLKTSGGTVGLLYGRSYLDFIPRTPPEFLYPGRPQDLAWEMKYEGVWLASGGILEISEAYWNFSRLGILLVPLLISYFVTRVSLKVCDCSNPMFAAFPLAIMATMSRWILYQTFALYKGTVAIAVFSLIVWITVKILVGGARPNSFPPHTEPVQR